MWLSNSKFDIAEQEAECVRGEQIIVFGLGAEEYAIDSLDVMEIDRMKEIRINVVPKVPNYVEGIINLRGDVVPVVNLKKRFGIVSPETGRKQRIIVVRSNNSLVGLLVDSVFGVKSTEGLEILPPTDEMAAEAGYISAIVLEEERMFFVINVDAIA